MTGNYICKECNGHGEVVFAYTQTFKPLAVVTCARCGGLGLIDWVENVVGKHKLIQQTFRRVEEEELKRKWRETSPGRWEEIGENNRGREIGLGSKGNDLSYGEIR
jgi:hypothetical protein